MTESAYLIASYRSIAKPFEIQGRHAHCGGTDKWTIAYIDENDARLLAENGLRWGAGEPDWARHYNVIQTMRAKRDLADAQNRLDAANAATPAKEE